MNYDFSQKPFEVRSNSARLVARLVAKTNIMQDDRPVLIVHDIFCQNVSTRRNYYNTQQIVKNYDAFRFSE